MVIAATAKIQQKHGMWFVPSQSGSGRYSVVEHNNEKHCSCPDHEMGHKCKHIFAVEYVIQRELFEDGTVTETRSVTVTEKRVTYPQAWASYNAAQVNESKYFQILLADLCKTLPAPEPKPGRPKTKPADAAFAAIFKVYSTMSARRFMGDMTTAKEEGHVSKIPAFNTILDWFDTDEATAVLEDFVTQSALPLAGVEDSFAIDATGFSGCRYVRWYDEKYGQSKQEIAWIKLHAVIGTKTNAVVAVKITNKFGADPTQLPSLAHDTAMTFNMKELSADKAYATQKNCEAVEALGAQFYPAFKRSASGKAGGAYGRTYHLMQLNREEYDRHYHKRSNAESAFSSIKRKFGAELKSKTDRAMKNECIAKIVAYNVTCVIAAMYELGVSPIMGCTNTLAAARQFEYGG